MEVHGSVSNNNDNELTSNQYDVGILGRFSNDKKYHIECDIFSDGTNTSFKSSVICSAASRSGIFYTFLESAGSSFEFIQDGTASNGNTLYFPGTAKFYGVN